MSQPTQIVRLDESRLVLGFDSGCMICSGLALRIEEQVGEKLEVMSLRDHRVEQWRKIALGEDAPWAPTLIEVKGLKVRAWTGWQMAVQLGRFLGPVATWRIMQALGEVGAVPKIEDSRVVEKLPERAAEAVVGMSRGQFLKGAAGAAVAMGVISGFGPFARRAQALEDWQWPTPERSVELRGGELRDYCNRIAKRESTGWAAGRTYAPAMQSGLKVSGADDNVAQGQGVKARAYEHFMANGNSYYACSFDLQGEKVLSFIQYKERRKDVKYEVVRWGLGPAEERFWAERAVINGSRFIDPGAPSQSVQAQADCPDSCQDYVGGQHLTTVCNSIDVLCVFSQVACAGCYHACYPGAPPLLCLSCVIPACGYALFYCCTSTCLCCVNCAVKY